MTGNELEKPQEESVEESAAESAPAPDKPADTPPQSQADSVEEMVARSEMERNVAALQSKYDRKLYEREQELADIKRQLDTLRIGQTAAAQQIAQQVEADPRIVQQALNRGLDYAELEQLRAQRAEDAQRREQLNWWADTFREAGVDPENSPEFAQAVKEWTKPAFTQRLKEAVARQLQEADNAKRAGAAAQVQHKAQAGDYAALDEAGGAAPSGSHRNATPADAGRLIKEGLEEIFKPRQ